MCLTPCSHFGIMCISLLLHCLLEGPWDSICYICPFIWVLHALVAPTLPPFGCLLGYVCIPILLETLCLLCGHMCPSIEHIVAPVTGMFCFVVLLKCVNPIMNNVISGVMEVFWDPERIYLIMKPYMFFLRMDQVYISYLISFLTL